MTRIDLIEKYKDLKDKLNKITFDRFWLSKPEISALQEAFADEVCEANEHCVYTMKDGKEHINHVERLPMSQLTAYVAILEKRYAETIHDAEEVKVVMDKLNDGECDLKYVADFLANKINEHIADKYNYIHNHIKYSNRLNEQIIEKGVEIVVDERHLFREEKVTYCLVAYCKDRNEKFNSPIIAINDDSISAHAMLCGETKVKYKGFDWWGIPYATLIPWVQFCLF